MIPIIVKRYVGPRLTILILVILGLERQKHMHESVDFLTHLKNEFSKHVKITRNILRILM